MQDAPKTIASKWDTLASQVWEKCLLDQQKEETYTKKIRMWSHMYGAVKQLSSDYTLYIVGSTISGFGSDASGLDLCIVDSTENGQIHFSSEFQHKSATILKEIEEHLKRIKLPFLVNAAIYSDFNLIPAEVPILRFKDTFHETEINFNYNNSDGIRNTFLIFCYGRIDRRVRPLAVVGKIWAQFHGINNPNDVTISSYSLALMVINFLQCGVSPPVLPCLHDLYPNRFQVNRIDSTQLFALLCNAHPTSIISISWIVSFSLPLCPICIFPSVIHSPGSDRNHSGFGMWDTTYNRFDSAILNVIE